MRKCALAFVLLSLVSMPVTAQNRRTRQRTPQTGISDLETPVATFQGTVKSISKKEIVLEMPEDQSIAFHISHKTKFVKDAKPIKPAAITAGATVMVEGRRDVMGNTDAVTVTLDPKPAAKPAPQNPS